jgi:enoyl-CoA hydratase/carnithine racemase
VRRKEDFDVDFEQIRCELDQRILTITLNRPERLNAFTGRMCDELIAAFDRADTDDDVGAVIVTGAGRAFCSGADLQSINQTWPRYRDNLSGKTVGERYQGDRGGQLTRRLFDSHKPVIAAINGPAVGVGLTMTLAMDIRMAAENTKMGFVFAARGIVPEACSSWFLPRIVGISRALEWCYSARMFRSEEALSAGLVRSVHAPDALLPAARELAREFIDNAAPVSMTLVRHMMWRMLGAAHPIDAHEIDTAGMIATGGSKDAAEGVGAFFAKRRANFTCKVSTDMPAFFPWWEDRGFNQR